MSGNSHNPVLRSTFMQIVLVVAVVAAAVVAVSFFPVNHTESPPFATPAFQRAWVSEASAATRAVDLWGSEPLSWRVEPYYGAPNDRRVVQYFERGRMEIEAGSSTVTLGRLARELITGEIDLGRGVSEQRQPSELAIDSGEPDPRVPTYLTLGRFVDDPAPDRTRSSARITEWIDRSGLIDQPSAPETRRMEEYVEETGHNLPDVTVELFDRPEFQDRRWLETFGYPISEPFWAEYRRTDEMRPSLIQVFERRILIYTPGVEEERSFTVAASGRHYFLWRYGTEPHPSFVEPPQEALVPELNLSENLSAWVYADRLGTPIDLALSSTGHLMILTNEGRILKAESLDPDGNPTGVTVWADGIEEPQGLITRGDSVLVTAADQIWWYREVGGQGVLDESEALRAEASNDGEEVLVRGKPIANSAGDIFARTEVEDSSIVLRELASEEVILTLDELLHEPGPVEFDSGDLLLSGRNEDGRSGVVLVRSVSRSVEPSEPVSIASFPPGSRIRALEVANEEIWPINALGDVIVAVQDEDDGRVYMLSRSQGTDEVEVIELVRGLSRPSALQVGLDGSIYVADSDLGHVIRIQYSK